MVRAKKVRKPKTTHRLTIETAQAIPAPTSPITAVVSAATATDSPLTNPLLAAGAEGESWLTAQWRPAMAWQYFTVCIFDFLLFPILTAVFNAIEKTPYVQWHPITLEGGGLYHLAMGAIITAATFGRSQEKIALFKSGLAGEVSNTSTAGDRSNKTGG